MSLENPTLPARLRVTRSQLLLQLRLKNGNYFPDTQSPDESAESSEMQWVRFKVHSVIGRPGEA
jgi:hypothetical protein